MRSDAWPGAPMASRPEPHDGHDHGPHRQEREISSGGRVRWTAGVGARWTRGLSLPRSRRQSEPSSRARGLPPTQISHLDPSLCWGLVVGWWRCRRPVDPRAPSGPSPSQRDHPPPTRSHSLAMAV